MIFDCQRTRLTAKLLKGRIILRTRLLAVLMVSSMTITATILGITKCAAEWQLVYSEDWSEGAAGWSAAQSMASPARPPAKIFLGKPVSDYVLWFYGSCAWALQGRPIPERPLKVSTTAIVFGSNRNALSVNIRNRGGQPIYKYGFCAGRIGANKQPPMWSYRDTDLTYDERIPYELYSIWVPHTGCFALGLKNLLTGEDRLSRSIWRCRSSAVPARIDLDQEGGQGPVALLKVDVYLWR